MRGVPARGGYPACGTVAADMITELSRFEPDDCFGNGNKFPEGLRLAKNLAPYRIGKRPHKQNREKIPPKYRKSYFLSIFDVFSGYFEGLLCFPIL